MNKIFDVNEATVIMDCGAVGAETTQNKTGELKILKSRGNNFNFCKMKKVFLILVAVIGFGFVANAQGGKEVRLKNGTLIYIEEKDNGIGPSTGWVRDLLDKVDWPSGFASCATQHDIDYGTLGVSKYDADMKLKRCAASVYSGTIGDLIKQQGWTLRQFSAAIGFFDISENMSFADAVYKLMCGSKGDNSYRTGQSMAQTTERYKREVEEALGMSIDTRYYYFIKIN